MKNCTMKNLHIFKRNAWEIWESSVRFPVSTEDSKAHPSVSRPRVPSHWKARWVLLCRGLGHVCLLITFDLFIPQLSTTHKQTHRHTHTHKAKLKVPEQCLDTRIIADECVKKKHSTEINENETSMHMWCSVKHQLKLSSTEHEAFERRFSCVLENSS